MQSFFRFLLLALLVALSRPLPVQAAEGMRVGVAAAVKENVTAITGEEAPRLLYIGEDVIFNERVITTKTSSAVVQFRDRSTLEIGPNATVIINRSVYNPVESVSEKTITVVAGAFRYVSGVAAKTSQTDIRTPVGTLGIRGSVVIGDVSDQGDVVLIPVQGAPTWNCPDSQPGVIVTCTAGPQTVPQGGALLATSGTGQTLTTPQVPASFAPIVQQVMTQLGVNLPPLQTFSPAQQAANAQDHLLSVNEQNQLQSGATGPVQPLSTTGVSAIADLMASANQQSGGLSAQDQANLNYISSVLAAQTAQHDANQAAGDEAIIRELSAVMTPPQLINLATALAALDPTHAPGIAVTTASLLPGQVQTILASIGSVVPAGDTASISTALNQLPGLPNTVTPPPPDPTFTSPNPALQRLPAPVPQNIPAPAGEPVASPG
jgi:hypothetical protein